MEIVLAEATGEISLYVLENDGKDSIVKKHDFSSDFIDGLKLAAIEE